MLYGGIKDGNTFFMIQKCDFDFDIQKREKIIGWLLLASFLLVSITFL